MTVPTDPGSPAVAALEERVEVALEDACCQWEESSAGYLRCLCARPAAATLDLLTGLELVRRWTNSPDAGALLRTLADHLDLDPPLAGVTPPRPGSGPLRQSPMPAASTLEETF